MVSILEVQAQDFFKLVGSIYFLIFLTIGNNSRERISGKCKFLKLFALIETVVANMYYDDIWILMHITFNAGIHIYDLLYQLQAQCHIHV